MLRRLGVFITPEENQRLIAAHNTSGMWLTGGQPLGTPQEEVDALLKKYGMPMDGGVDMKNGEFCRVVDEPEPG